jgi:rubrerythrin
MIQFESARQIFLTEPGSFGVSLFSPLQYRNFIDHEPLSVGMRHEIKAVKPVGSTTQIVLRFCQEIEATCSSIYSYFAEIFAEDPALQKLWSKIAAEELNHAQIVAMAMRCKGLILNKNQYDMAKFRSSAKTIREVLDNLQNMTPSAEEALRAAINLEKRLSEFHLDHVLKFTSLAEEKFSISSWKETGSTTGSSSKPTS